MKTLNSFWSCFALQGFVLPFLLFFHFCFSAQGFKNHLKFLIDISTFFQKKKKITIQQKTKTWKTKTRHECRFGEKEALFGCFYPFEARLHIYWFMIMETWLWDLVSETPQTLFAWRLWAPLLLRPVGGSKRNSSAPHRVWFVFISFISNSLTERINWIFFRHILAFLNRLDLLITMWHWFFFFLLWFTDKQNIFFCSIFLPCRSVVILSFDPLSPPACTKSSESNKRLVLQPRQ